MRFPSAVPALVALLALSPGPALGFEGVMKWRTLQVERDALARVAGDPVDAEAAFAVPIDLLTSLHGEAQMTEATTYIKGSRLRAESTAAAGGVFTLVDLESGEILVVNPAEKKALEIGQEDVRSLEARAASARGVMRQRMNAAPAEQRGQMERLLGRVAEDDSGATSTELRPLRRSETISGLKAQGYRFEFGNRSVEGWVTQDRADVREAVQSLERLQRRLLGRKDLERKPATVLGEKGLVLRLKTLDRQRFTWEELVEIESRPLGDELFSVPEGFVRTSSEVMVRRAGEPPAPPPPPAAPQ